MKTLLTRIKREEEELRKKTGKNPINIRLKSCIRAKYTQKEFSKIAGMKWEITVSDIILRKRKVTRPEAQKWAGILGVEVSEIFEDQDIRPEKASQSKG